MWKKSLKKSDFMGMACVLSAPSIVELQIVPFEEISADGWTRSQISEVVSDMIKAGRRGDIEVSVKTFLEYMRSRIPHMTEEYYVPDPEDRIEYNFPERIKEIIELWQEYEGEENEEAGSESDIPEGCLSCEIDADSAESITDAQIAAIEFVLENEEGLCEIIAESLEDYYDGLDWDDEDEPILDEEGRDITNCVSCDYVRVTAKEYQGMAYTEFQMEVIWDEEHRINVIFHGDRVIDTLGSGGGWIDQENDEQVNRPVINPFTGKPIPKSED